MSEKDIPDTDIDELYQVGELEEKQKRVLTKLLDDKLNQQNRHLAVRGHMGQIRIGSESRFSSIPSYSVMHTMDWVSKHNVLMGSEMDFMRNMVDPETGRIIVDEESAEEMKQRAPDWSRQAELTTYLVQENLRKFGTILAVISPAWIDDPNHDNWGADGRAIKSAASFEALDSKGVVGLLDLSDLAVYALDGQHRVMGIRGVRDLLEGGLNVKTSANSIKKTIPKDEFLEKVEKDTGDLRRILSEEINVEYIPAVLLGETKEEASKRIRSVFVAINSYAKKTEKGENILLSENDGFSIVARHVAHHRLLRTNEGRSRVNWKSATIKSGESVQISTLATLWNAVEIYNRHTEHFSWTPMFKGVLPLRPKQAELDRLTAQVNQFLDYCTWLPVFKRVAAGDDLVKIREFSEYPGDDKEGHLLVRPIGLPILAASVGRALKKHDLDTIFRKLVKFDKSGGFTCHSPGSVFYGVTYDPANKKIRAQQGNQELAARILNYLLSGGDAAERDEVARRVRETRRVGESEWIDVDGEYKDINTDHYELPHPIQL